MSETNEKMIGKFVKEKGVILFSLYMSENEWETFILTLISGLCEKIYYFPFYRFHDESLYASSSSDKKIETLNKKESQEKIKKFASLFKELASNKKLSKLKNITIDSINLEETKEPIFEKSSFISFLSEDCFRNLENLEYIFSHYLTGNELITLLQAPRLRKLSIRYFNYNSKFDFNHLKTAFLKSTLEIMNIQNTITDEIIQLLAQHQRITRLSVSYGKKIKADLLKILENSAIQDLLLSVNDIDIEAFLSLLSTNRISALLKNDNSHDTIKLTQEQCENLEKAFFENTSLAHVSDDHPMFKEFILKDSNSFYYSNFFGRGMEQIFFYAERNCALIKASNRKETLECIKEKLNDTFSTLNIKTDPFFSLPDLILSYAKPIGKELFTVFNSENAKKFFPLEFDSLKSYGFFTNDFPVLFTFNQTEREWHKMKQILKSGKCTSLEISYPIFSLSQDNLEKKKQIERVQELISLLEKLIKNDQLDNLKDICIRDATSLRVNRFHYFGYNFCDIYKLPSLQSLVMSDLYWEEWVNIANSKSLRKLHASNRSDFELIFCREDIMNEATLKSSLEKLKIETISEKSIQFFSQIKSLSSLTIVYHCDMTQKLLMNLCNSSITDLCLDARTFDIDCLIALLLKNCITGLRWKSFDFDFVTKEEKDKLMKALYENISLIEDSHSSLSFLIYQQRNLALKEASEKAEASEFLKRELVEFFDFLNINLPTSLSDIILSYGKPVGKELLTVFNSEKAKMLFPSQYVILKKFDFYK